MHNILIKESKHISEDGLFSFWGSAAHGRYYGSLFSSALVKLFLITSKLWTLVQATVTDFRCRIHLITDHSVSLSSSSEHYRNWDSEGKQRSLKAERDGTAGELVPKNPSSRVTAYATVEAGFSQLPAKFLGKGHPKPDAVYLPFPPHPFCSSIITGQS